MNRCLILAHVLILLAACGGEPTPAPDLVATRIAVEIAAHATMTARASTATSTPEPTAVPSVTPTPGPSVTPPPAIEAQEYAIYSALIRQNPVGYNLGSAIVVRGHTTTGTGALEMALEQGSALPSGLVDSYRSRNGESYTLEPNLDVEQGYTVLLREEYDALFPRGGAKWAEFYARYPEARGFVMFSRAGFDDAGDTALVEMGFRCGDLCGTGGLYVVVKEAGGWVVQDTLVMWES